MDGILVYTPNGSGVRFNQIIYSGGYLGAVGGGASGSNGIYFDALSFGSESTWTQLRIGNYAGNLLYVNMDHFIVQHLTTAYTYAGQAVFNWAGGWGMQISYWHHFCSNAAPSFLIEVGSGCLNGNISNLMKETSAYSAVSSYDITNASNSPVNITSLYAESFLLPPNFSQPNVANIFSWNNTTKLYGTLAYYGGLELYGSGIPPIVGSDGRKGLTAVDSSPIQLGNDNNSPTVVYRITVRIYLTAGTSPSATYNVTYWENGIEGTISLVASAINTIYEATEIVQMDTSRYCTSQLTAISGTGTTANVSTTIEVLHL